MGGGDEDTYNVTISGAFSGSTTDRAGRALERAVNQHSDTVNLSVTESGGWVENSQLYNGDEVEAIGMDNFNPIRAMNGEPPYEDQPIDKLPLQGMTFDRMDNWMMGVEGSGIESTDDMADRDVYVLAPGMGTRVALEVVLKNAGYWDQLNHLEVGPGDLPGAVEEGRIEALPGQGTDPELLGYHQEVDARADVYALEHTDNWVQGIEDTEGLETVETEPFGYDQDVTQVTDQVTAFSITSQWRFGPDVEDEAVYELCRVANEHVDTIQEADPTYPDTSDPEVMVEYMDPDQPFHPGAAEFYQDEGVWDDSWEVSEDEFTI